MPTRGRAMQQEYNGLRQDYKHDGRKMVNEVIGRISSDGGAGDFLWIPAREGERRGPRWQEQ